MAIIKDHYVSKTYLKSFCNAQDKLVVYNKEYGKISEKTTAQICKEAGGSDNQYLEKNRAIEDYLTPIENNWNKSINLFKSNGNVDFQAYLDAKYIISAYIAYLRNYTPAVVRCHQIDLEALVKTEMKILYKNGQLPEPPKELENTLEDIEANIKVDVDSKYPRAKVAGTLHGSTETIFKSAWMRVENNSNTPFITSDNPCCLWYNGNSDLPMIYLPLTPKVAVLVKPFINKEDTKHYDHSADDSRIAKPEFVKTLNEQVIKHAEEKVISNYKSDEILKEVTAYKDWKFDCKIQKIPFERGELIVSKFMAAKNS